MLSALSASDVGFDEARFVTPGAATMLMCYLCRSAPKVGAQLLSCCGQGACRKCLQDAGQQGCNIRCPLCRACAVVSKDRAYETSLSFALVRCKYSPCCRWEGAFASALDHEAVCEVTLLYAKLRERNVALNEADSEIRAVRAEVRALEEDARAKDRTIHSLEGQLEDVKEKLQVSLNDVFKRAFMIRSMLACPPHVLEAAHDTLILHLPQPAVPSSAALCRAGGRSRSRSPRRR